MKPTRLFVSFGQASPFSRHLVKTSPGWTDEKTWQGWFPIGADVGSGTHTLRVAGAVSVEGNFRIPPDTYHDFFVDLEDGELAVSNGLVEDQFANSLLLTWSPPEDQSRLFGYNLLRKGEADSGFQLIGNAPASATSFEDVGLMSKTKYIYQIYEFDIDFNSRQLTSSFSGITNEKTTALDAFLYSIGWHLDNLSAEFMMNATDFIRLDQKRNNFLDWQDLYRHLDR